MSESGDHPGRRGLELIDQALAERPHKDDYRLAEAMTQLCAFREMLIACNRRPERTAEDGRRLARLNAVISILSGVYFPIAQVPWDALANARSPLAELVSSS